MNKISITFISILFPLSIAFAQQNPDSVDRPFEAHINLIGKSFGDSIILRWAPSTPGAWSYLNEYGYIVERAPLSEQQDFDPNAYKRLTNNPIMPLSLEDWERVVNSSEDKALSAIAAQSLYGKGFSTGDSKIFDRADEFSNRYSFSLLAADLSPITADALGLRFVDTSVQQNAHYIYRAYPSMPPTNYKIDTAYLVIQNSPAVQVQKPIIEEVYGAENSVTISWEKAVHESLFSAYIIERSENEGHTFERLTEIPFINPASDNVDTEVKYFQYMDSVKENYKRYYYRLIGITPFGEKSPPSEEVMGMGQDRTPPPPPENVYAQPIGDGIVKITWEMPNPPSDLDAFYIGRGDDLDKNFQPLHDHKIPKDSLSFIDYNSDKLSGNYYVVAAVDTAGNGNISMVSYAAILDSIPPSAPVGLTGEIDSSGVVTLRWELGDEIDLAGYMVYFTNAADHVYSTLNEAPLADTVYKDTIQIKTLTKKIYYKIKAVDTRWNYSEYSAALELTRPDIIPPTTPVFSKYKVTKDGVNLEWIPSSSYDVAGYELEVYTNNELVRKVFVEKRDSAKYHSYTDSKIEPGNIYTYIVLTVDESGLRSVPSNPISVKSIDLEQKASIDDLSAFVNAEDRLIELKWSYDVHEKLKRFIVYRAVDGASFVTYKSLSPEDNTFQDKMIRPESKYEYTIRAVYDTGKQTPFSNIVSAKLSVD